MWWGEAVPVPRKVRPRMAPQGQVRDARTKPTFQKNQEPWKRTELRGRRNGKETGCDSSHKSPEPECISCTAWLLIRSCPNHGTLKYFRIEVKYKNWDSSFHNNYKILPCSQRYGNYDFLQKHNLKYSSQFIIPTVPSQLMPQHVILRIYILLRYMMVTKIQLACPVRLILYKYANVI